MMQLPPRMGHCEVPIGKGEKHIYLYSDIPAWGHVCHKAFHQGYCHLEWENRIHYLSTTRKKHCLCGDSIMKINEGYPLAVLQIGSYSSVQRWRCMHKLGLVRLRVLVMKISHILKHIALILCSERVDNGKKKIELGLRFLRSAGNR